MNIRIPNVGDIIYYDGVVCHYYRVVDIDGVKGKLQFLGQNPNNKSGPIYNWDFQVEYSSERYGKYKKVE